ncbi:hsp90 co-chaperone Cdc37-like 1 [Echinops telfairi]|uniref:Hsp90 co-chaperone Cdc37-like 1 n=1 Tax=Echinops telfairi TaxID=9371 RepID=A0ABM0J4E7_ECHTE|nr:hsp90 co-chaperone Cdc37-like 1 [Echinops telfairi]
MASSEGAVRGRGASPHLSPLPLADSPPVEGAPPSRPPDSTHVWGGSGYPTDPLSSCCGLRRAPCPVTEWALPPIVGLLPLPDFRPEWRAVVRQPRLPEDRPDQMYSRGIELACQKQKEFVKSSVACKWNLAEAQQKLGSLALHNSESLDQERARVQTAVSELRQREEQWRQKEAALVQRERTCLWSTDAISKDVFNKSFINQDKQKETEDEDKTKSFMQKYEQKIRHFGMLSRWDDSQRFLSDHPDLVCEETTQYLSLWCFRLEAEQKGALMEQIAHQAVVMQFIMEMAKNCNVDPRGCFRLFFQKAKAEEEGYFEAFKNELEAFKSRVRLYSQSHSFPPLMVQNHVLHSGDGSIGVLESFPQNPGPLQCSVNAALCSFDPAVHREDDDPKMMDTA